MIPEQRVLRFAADDPEQVANVSASDQEIAKYYNANKATYAPNDTRSLSQVMVPDQATANGIAARAKAGATPGSGGSTRRQQCGGDVTQGPDPQAYAGVAGDKAAAAVFSAAPGAVVGPVQSDFGWVVVKVNSVKAVGGKSLDQARAEIAAKLNADKRKAAIEDLVDKVQTAIDDGNNSPKRSPRPRCR